MANYTLAYSESIKAWSNVALSLVGSETVSKALRDGFTVGEAVSGSGAVAAEGTVVESISIKDTLALNQPDASLCCPNVGDYGLIVLQERTAGSLPGADVVTLPGPWQDSFQYLLQAIDQPKILPWIEEIVTENEEIMMSGEAREYYSETRMFWKLIYEQWYCNQGLHNFLIQYAASWTKNTPDFKERRILLFPYGRLAKNTYGTTLPGFPVKFVTFPLATIYRHSEIEEREGAFQGECIFAAIETDLHDEYQIKVPYASAIIGR